MHRSITMGLLTIAMAASSSAQVWATAIATRPSDKHVIVYRYLKEPSSGFDTTSQSERVTITWKYQGDQGMPAMTERKKMDAFEDALMTALDGGHPASLVVVSTGNDMRRWTYYAQSKQDFASRLEQVSKSMAAPSIELRWEKDPAWQAYEAFRATVKEQDGN